MYISVFYEHILEAAAQENLSVEEVLKIVKSSQIDGVELDYGRLLDKEGEGERIYRQLASEGLAVNGVYGFFDFGKKADYLPGAAFIDQAVGIGAKSVLIIPGFIEEGLEKERAEKEIQNMMAVVRELAAIGREKGITVAMEDFDDIKAPFATAGQLLAFLKQVPGLTCAFDTGNFLYSEEDVIQAFELLAPYIGIVHCKDRSLTPKRGEEPKLTVKGRAMYSSPVGFGDIPMKQLISLVKENAGKQNRGDMTFIIEHFDSRHQLEDMQKSAAWLLAQ